jgi:hypothetical protein
MDLFMSNLWIYLYMWCLWWLLWYTWCVWWLLWYIWCPWWILWNAYYACEFCGFFYVKKEQYMSVCRAPNRRRTTKWPKLQPETVPLPCAVTGARQRRYSLLCIIPGAHDKGTNLCGTLLPWCTRKAPIFFVCPIPSAPQMPFDAVWTVGAVSYFFLSCAARDARQSFFTVCAWRRRTAMGLCRAKCSLLSCALIENAQQSLYRALSNLYRAPLPCVS